MWKRRLGRLYITATWDYDLDEVPSLPFGFAILARRFVYGITLSHASENPYLRLYGGIGCIEIYFDRDRSWEVEEA